MRARAPLRGPRALSLCWPPRNGAGFWLTRRHPPATRAARVGARANRGGFVTGASPPACDGVGRGGRRWRQRAAVCGLVGDEELLNALARVAEAHRLTILVRTVDEDSRRPGITVTQVDGEAYTAFGGRLTRSELQHVWLGTSWSALAEIEAAWQVTLIDPMYGRDNRLWTALDEAIDLLNEVP